MPNFVSFAASVAELAHGEKSHTQSITQSLTRLFDAPGTEAFASEQLLLTSPRHNIGLPLSICKLCENVGTTLQVTFAIATNS